MTSEEFKKVLGEMFSEIEEKRLAGVHPDLVKVIRKAKELGGRFRVAEGLRSLAQQERDVAAGVSSTLHSRHLASKDGLARAMDVLPLVNGKPVLRNWTPYYPLAKIIKDAAKRCKVTVEWGGDWKHFPDGPHWQLPWRLYP